MAKALSPAAWAARAVEKLGGAKAVAEKIGRSPQTVRDVLAGRNSGQKLKDAFRDLAKGKREYTMPPPTPKQVKAAREAAQKGAERAARPIARPAPIVPRYETALSVAEDQLKNLDPGRYVVHVTSKRTGRSITLFRKGGVNPDTLLGAPSLYDAINAQAGAQAYDDVDWDSVVAIEFEEYY